jgi:hypothetical protein
LQGGCYLVYQISSQGCFRIYGETTGDQALEV